MFLKRRISYRAVALVAGFILCALSTLANAQSKNDLSAFVGRWQINPAKTKMGRNGPASQNILRSTTFTFVFVPSGKGLRMDVYSEYPQPEPSRTATVITDGRLLPCEGKNSCLTAGGDPKEQTYAFYKMDSHLLARLFYIKGKIYDYSSLCVSADGKTLTLISWAPETPEYQNIQVFDKQP